MAAQLTAHETIAELTDEIRRKDASLSETCTALAELARACINNWDVNACISDVWVRLGQRGVPLPPLPTAPTQVKPHCPSCIALETKFGLEIHALQVELHAVRTIDEDLMKDLSTAKHNTAEQLKAAHAEIRELTDRVQELHSELEAKVSVLARKQDWTLLTASDPIVENIVLRATRAVECQADVDDPKLHGLSAALLEANSTISELQNDLMVCKETLSGVRLELQAKQDEARTLHTVVDSASQREADTRSIIASLQSAIDQLSREAAAKSTVTLALQSELAKLQDEKERNDVIWSNLQREVETLTVANVKLQARCMQQNAVIDTSVVADVATETIAPLVTTTVFEIRHMDALSMASTVALCAVDSSPPPPSTAHVSSLLSEVETLKLEAQQARREINNLTSALSHATACWSQTEVAKTEAEEKLSDTLMQVGALQNLAKSADAELSRRKSTIDELSSRIQLMQSSLDTALADCKVHENEANIVREEIATLYQQYEKVSSELREHKMRLSVSDQSFSATERLLASTKLDLEHERANSEAQRAEIARLKGEASALSTSITTIRGEAAERSNDVALLHDQLSQERDVTQQLEARCSELARSVALLETQLASAKHEAVEAKEFCAAEVSVYKTELLQLQLELDKAEAESASLKASLKSCEAMLEGTKEQSERWSSQCKLLSSEVQRLSLGNDEQAEALAGAQETVKLLQSLLVEADSRDNAMRLEVSQVQSQLLSVRRELELRHQQDVATITSLQESSQRMQASLLADLHSCERQLGKQREVEMTLRAELDDARKDVVRLSALSQELEALKADASGYRVDLASMKGSQHRMTQQLQFLSDQLAQANHDKLELTKELEEMSDVVIRMESQLRQSRGAHQEAGR